MSVANLIVQPDCAYLVTDSGHFRKDGTVLYLGPKCMVLSGISVALATTGSILCGHIAREMGSAPATMDEFMRNIRGWVKAAYARTGLDPVERWSRIVIAHYSHKQGHAVGASFFTAPEAGPENLKPWTFYPAQEIVMPAVDKVALFGRDLDLRDPLEFDPLRHSMAILDQQRRQRTGWANLPDGHTAVAGDIDLTAVSRDGIEVTTLHSYPDRVGERIAG